MKRSFLICIGNSGGGKTTFIDNLPNGLYYNLRSWTTRAQRAGEQDGIKYFFVDEGKFDSGKFAVMFWVNKDLWEPGKPKWFYGVPEFEIYNNIGKNLVYDVIEPCHARQIIDWFGAQDFASDYDIKIAWFIPPIDNDIIEKRANMPDDTKVRTKNTCTIYDIFNALGHKPDFILQPRCAHNDSQLNEYIESLLNNN